MVNVSKSLSVRGGSAITAIRSARKSPAGPMSVSKLPRSLTGTAHPLFDADTESRRRYCDISLRVNDCPSRIVFECKRGRMEQNRGSGGDEMRHRQEAFAKDDWDGEFGSYDEWARLGPQPPYRSATFFDAQGRRCITQQDFARARDNKAFPVRYRWETTDPGKLD
jgi:hypothetical protein